jgi:DNA-binding response OmpR family regulator
MSATILIIEDDEAVAGSLQEGLERDGYTVIWTTTGGAGVQVAQSGRPHLIILDIRLPDGSGFDFCRQMRQLGLKQPLLMLTARRDELDKVLGLEMGADDYITKPYSLRELLSRIRAQLRRAYGEFAPSESDHIYVGDLMIDRALGQAFIGKRSLNLTPTEFRLLVFLVRHSGQALTRAQIVEEVWGYDADVESERAVNVHVRRLREKVEIDPSHPTMLLTVPGIGYRFVTNS